MEQYLNNNQNEFLGTLLANPAENARLYAYDLQRLVNDYPQSGALQALLALAGEDKNLRKASTYLNPQSVYKLTNMPSSLVGVPDERIYISNAIAPDEVVSPPLDVVNDFADDGAVSEPLVNMPESIEAPEAAQTFTDMPELPVVEENAGEPVVPEIPLVADDVPQPVIENEAGDEIGAVKVLPDEVAADAGEHLPGQTQLTPEETTTAIESVTFPPEMPPIPEPVADAPLPGNTQADARQYAPPHDNAIADAAWENLLAGTIRANKMEGNADASDAFGRHSVQQDQTSDNEAAGVLVEAEAQHPIPDDVSAPVAEETGHSVKEIPETEGLNADIPAANVAGSLVPEPLVQESGGMVNKPIDDEVFDEIVGIDQISIAPLAEVSEQPLPQTNITQEAKKAEFFTFDKMYGEHKPSETAEEEVALQAEAADIAGDDQAQQQDVSKYHDEKMPYSFLWWLDKTRKEHAGIYQPYVNGSKPAAAAKTKKVSDELQQQYFENIFHITSIEELERNTADIPPVPADHRRHEQLIIEKFIKEEPQIKPQSSDKLDNENKAKKSSEDRDELVSETLAAIYSDQMLYHKAISSYKKLMLKFPQKSRYFAEKIEQLEKKIN